MLPLILCASVDQDTGARSGRLCPLPVSSSLKHSTGSACQTHPYPQPAMIRPAPVRGHSTHQAPSTAGPGAGGSSPQGSCPPSTSFPKFASPTGQLMALDTAWTCPSTLQTQVLSQIQGQAGQGHCLQEFGQQRAPSGPETPWPLGQVSTTPCHTRHLEHCRNPLYIPGQAQVPSTASRDKPILQNPFNVNK